MLGKREAWPQLNSGNPLVIAGPCSAETEEQVLEIAKQIKKDERVSLYRAGIWKPRTRPGSFEGVGEQGLEWLKKVQSEYGMQVTTEVAKAEHVEKALKSGIDVLWIGARTTANPFAVQEIADALKGVSIPVLVKNPVNPDVALWMGAIERLEKTGINRLGAIHRGVSQFEKSIYRNKPEWQMVVQLREQLSDFLIINDPSHITGNRELIASVSQTAMDLQMDGLMIETHIDPDNAWSDAAQQVTPEQLSMILSRLILREETPEGVTLESIDELRKSINYVDKQLIELLSYRNKLVENIADFKADNNMSIFQENRWKKLLKERINDGQELGLTEDYISQIFHAIHQASIDVQGKRINKD